MKLVQAIFFSLLISSRLLASPIFADDLAISESDAANGRKEAVMELDSLSDKQAKQDLSPALLMLPCAGWHYINNTKIYKWFFYTKKGKEQGEIRLAVAHFNQNKQPRISENRIYHILLLFKSTTSGLAEIRLGNHLIGTVPFMIQTSFVDLNQNKTEDGIWIFWK